MATDTMASLYNKIYKITCQVESGKHLDARGLPYLQAVTSEMRKSIN